MIDSQGVLFLTFRKDVGPEETIFDYKNVKYISKSLSHAKNSLPKLLFLIILSFPRLRNTLS